MPLPGVVPREYEALQFCLAPWEFGTQGHNLMVGLSTLSGPHMRLRNILLYQPDLHLDPTPLVHSWHDPPFHASSASEATDTPRDQRTPGEAPAGISCKVLDWWDRDCSKKMADAPPPPRGGRLKLP